LRNLFSSLKKSFLEFEIEEMLQFVRFNINYEMGMTQFLCVDNRGFNTTLVNPEFRGFGGCGYYRTFFNRHRKCQQFTVYKEIGCNTVRHIKVGDGVLRELFMKFLQNSVSIPVLLKNLLVTAVITKVFFNKPVYFALL